jgi:hypothetical protein
MSEHDEFKHSLLEASWRLYKKVTVQGARGSAELEIRIPPPNVLSELLQDAKKLKEAKDAPEAKHEEAQDFGLRVIAATVWRPGAVRSLFTLDEVKRWPYASAVQADCLAAVNAGTGMEAAKGN